MFLRQLAVGIVPSYFVDRVRWRRIRAEEAAARPIFATSWQEACGRAGSYSAETINRFRVERWQPEAAPGGRLRGNILNLVILAAGRADLAITDLGGAAGELGASFMAVYPGASYTVVENPTMATLMAGRQGPQFATKIPDSCDIFYTSGTLQYLDDPMATLEKGLKSAKIAAVLLRNRFSAVGQFDLQKSTLFENGDGPIPSGYDDIAITHPRRTLNEADVLRLADACGFDCKAAIGSGGEEVYDRQLVFWRRP